MSSRAASSAASVAAAAAQRSQFRNPYYAAKQAERARVKLYHRNLARAAGGTDWRGKPIHTPYTWNIKKGDLVQVTQSVNIKDRSDGGGRTNQQNKFGQVMVQKWFGVQGKVMQVLHDQEKIIVEGVNLRTRSVKSNESSRGFSYEAESPIPYQHVKLVDPSTNQPIEGGIKLVKKTDGTRGVDRVVRSTGTIIPLPSKEGKEPKPKPVTNERSDTTPEDTLAETYVRPSAFTMIPTIERDDSGNPKLTKEEIPITREEMRILKKRVKRGEQISQKDKRLLETGVRSYQSVTFVPEDLELRAARIKF